MHNLEKILACPECKSKLEKLHDIFVCTNCRSKYPIIDGIPILLPTDITDFKKMEANHWSEEAKDCIETNQLDTLRINVITDYLLSAFESLPKNSLILEIGCGTAFQSSKLMKKGHNNLLLTDVSLGMIKQAQENVRKEKLSFNCFFMVSDAEKLPFFSNVFAGIHMTGVLHHLPNPIVCLKEIKRCLRPQGLAVLVCEPNRWITILTRRAHRLLKTPLSIGDTTTRGYTKKQIGTMFKEAEMRILKVKAFWFISGFINSGISVMFKLLHLSRRPKLPLLLDKSILSIEKSLVKVPLIDKIGWLWTVVGKKDSSS